jgi:hypothetical protein
MDRKINAEKISKIIRKDIDRNIKEKNFMQKEELKEHKK